MVKLRKVKMFRHVGINSTMIISYFVSFTSWQNWNLNNKMIYATTNNFITAPYMLRWSLQLGLRANIFYHSSIKQWVSKFGINKSCHIFNSEINISLAVNVFIHSCWSLISHKLLRTSLFVWVTTTLKFYCCCSHYE